MGCRPDLVASSSASLAPVLQHFGDLLSKGSRGRSIKVPLVASCLCRWVALPFTFYKITSPEFVLPDAGLLDPCAPARQPAPRTQQ